MLVIRLHRFGKKNNPSFRLAVSEKHKDTHGDYLEALGHYQPKQQPSVVSLNKERIQYWISVGAQPSPTVQNLLVREGVIDGPKVKAFKVKKDPKAEAAKAAPQA